MILLGILFSLSLVSAISIKIDMKKSFGIGEEIYFDYIITSDVSQEVEHIAVGGVYLEEEMLGVDVNGMGRLRELIVNEFR